MEQRVTVKQEYIGGSSSSSRRQYSDGAPRPMEGLHEAAPPPFLTKTYEMVDDLSTDRIVSWSRGGQSFAVWDPHAFSTIVLPGYFKHNNFSSFVRQLNTYGFRKVDADKWEFANDSFLQGQKHLLKNIRRRKTSAHLLPQHQSISPCLELGRFGLNTEIDRLRRDKQVLMMEIVKLKQQQMNSKAYLQEMELRLQKTEHKQHQMMSFLAKAMQNPEFIHQLVHQKEKRKELEEVISKKRRRPIEDGESSRGNPVKSEPLDFGVAYGFQVSELEALALEMQGIGRAKKEDQEEIERLGCYDKELDEGFWEELLNDGFDDDEENADVLADRLEFLGSSPK